MLPTPDDLSAILRAELGERRYVRFVRQLHRARTDGLVAFWQSRVLDKLEASRALVLPRYASSLAELLPALATNPIVTEADVPAWITVEWLEYGAPTQGWGSAGRWKWYFRSRHEEWSIGAERDATTRPVGVFENGPDSFFTSEDYGFESFEASYMPLDEARYFIVRELTRLRARPDSQI
jgi:hypothetical protein